MFVDLNAEELFGSKMWFAFFSFFTVFFFACGRIEEPAFVSDVILKGELNFDYNLEN